jgi:hypothetical protein
MMTKNSYDNYYKHSLVIISYVVVVVVVISLIFLLN